MLRSVLYALSIATFVVKAAPQAATTTSSAASAGSTTQPQTCQIGGCQVESNYINVPSGQTNVTTPMDATLDILAFAIGTQNYTCATSDNTSSPVLFGALAALYDGSCLDPTKYQTYTQGGEIACATYGVEVAQKGTGLYYIGAHYFQNTSVGDAPTFDLRGGALYGDPEGFVIGKKGGSLNSPNNPNQDVPWLSLTRNNVTSGIGTLADFVLRVNTAGGQPPQATCDGLPSSFPVCYSAIYAFLNATS